jgi:chromate transporter
MALVQGLFYGLKPAVVAVVVEAVARIGKRALKNYVMVLIAALAFVAIFFLELPFPLIVLAAAMLGFVGSKFWPATFVVIKGHSAKVGGAAERHAVTDDHVSPVRPTLRRTIVVLAVWLAIWLGPVAALYWRAGPDSVYTKESLFFSKAAMVTFGGAYSVLAYVADQCVETYEWLEPGEMLDGLGMAETTPGPLIQVVQFVGFMGAYRNPGQLSPLVAGIAGSVVTTWVTYAPCFLWIFLGAPYIESLRGRAALNAALSAVTAAVVGVILQVNELHTYGIRLLVPDWTTIDVASVAIACGAAIAMFRYKVGMIATLIVAAAVGAAYRVVF